MNKVEAATAFFERISASEDGYLLEMMQQELGPELVQFMNQYAQAFSEQIGEVENLAGTLLVLGYLLRVHEESLPANEPTTD